MAATTHTTSGEVARWLQSAGLRVTRQRVAVLEAVSLHPHLTADEILAAAGDQPVTRQAVYLIVADLVRAGLLGRLDMPGQPARYELQRHDNHHHAVCTQCGAVVDVPCTTGIAPCLETPAGLPITVSSADVVFRGLCHSCQPAST